MTSSSKSPKRAKYPTFLVVGLVCICEHGSNRPDIKVQGTCYANYQDEVHRHLTRDARHRLERMGLTKVQLDTLVFEETEITDVHALDAKGVRRVFGEHVDATLDNGGMPDTKRNTLIRQRRLMPWDHDSMLDIYGTKVVATEGGAA